MCESARIMGCERESDAVVNDPDIRVMTFLFGNFGDLVHENHGVDEIFKRHEALNLVPLQSPVMQLLQPLGYLLPFQLHCHLDLLLPGQAAGKDAH